MPGTLDIFYFTIRPPPSSTLFPYTRSSDLVLPALGEEPDWELELGVVLGGAGRFLTPDEGRDLIAGSEEARSEEHTSELQSHSDLVCRLLLENKKLPD